MPAEYLKNFFKKYDIELNFYEVDFKDSVKQNEYDFVLMSFGAADPSPVTWLSLVLESEVDFIADYDKLYSNKFRKLKKIMILYFWCLPN